MPATPQLMASYISEAADAHISHFSAADHDSKLNSASVPPPGAASEEPSKDYVSKIGILPSSMPFFHNQYMEQRRANRRTDEGEPLDPHELGLVSNLSLDAHPREQSREEQAATARRLKPHSRSTVQLQHINASAAENPDVGGQVDRRKAKSTKWQFGIRSRNQPLDAMLCIYRALAAQGAQWQIPPPKTAPKHGPGPYPINTGATHFSSTDARFSESPEKRDVRSRGDHHGHDYSPGSADGTHHNRRSTGFSYPSQDEENDEDVDPSVFPDDYIPKDPWCIHVRWRNDGMSPPGIAHASSAHGSGIDLNMDEQARRRSSIIGSLSSATGSTTSVTGTYGIGTSDSACYVYMDVQLYMLEADCYLVDFKCAGYETIVESVVSESERKLTGSGFRVADKDVTSPQPFLDLTNRLVIYLARGG